ncbi:hypothetical protein FACS18945_4110 [Bacteroidia bacterium]|nr:hypothetical protein FACS18945_4110 [Bacteroidia bacterium]
MKLNLGKIWQRSIAAFIAIVMLSVGISVQTASAAHDDGAGEDPVAVDVLDDAAIAGDGEFGVTETNDDYTADELPSSDRYYEAPIGDDAFGVTGAMGFSSVIPNFLSAEDGAMLMQGVSASVNSPILYLAPRQTYPKETILWGLPKTQCLWYNTRG